jgi:dethiobiotin synthetase
MKEHRHTIGGTIIMISGIDTGIGKTVATGLLARWLHDGGRRVITMKMVQTGCANLSEDIVRHRELTGLPLQEEDAVGLTCPYVFSLPCSPHLAARLDGRRIEPQVIVEHARQLAEQYEYVLVEGAGGLFVPLNEAALLIDLPAAQQWPVVLVTSPRLGSINHTLAALEALERRSIRLQGLIYNLADAPDTDPRIVDDSRRFFARRLQDMGRAERLCDLPTVACTPSYCVDFSPLFD